MRRNLLNTVRRNPVGRSKSRHNTAFTVMAYEGPAGAARLQQDLDVQACLPRHPNLLQLFGVTMTRNLYALTYHGDLIPWYLAEKACRSYVAKVIFWYLTIIQSKEVELAFGIEPLFDRCTIGSSGVLSVEIGEDQPFSGPWTTQSNQDLWQPQLRTTLIDCMQQDDSKLMNLLSVDDVVEVLYHWSPGTVYLPAHPQIPRIHLGAVYHHAGRSSTHLTMEAAVKIFSFPVAISETVDEWDSTEFLQYKFDSPYLRWVQTPSLLTIVISIEPPEFKMFGGHSLPMLSAGCCIDLVSQ
ncbi:hypothetical protein C8F01DRAFT_677772 [Mycena amicta]|nr:hypothetical protein C8F01DRAFT_677772 [Mycena amicta]